MRKDTPVCDGVAHRRAETQLRRTAENAAGEASGGGERLLRRAQSVSRQTPIPGYESAIRLSCDDHLPFAFEHQQKHFHRHLRRTVSFA
jgi:hypothetical protein